MEGYQKESIIGKLNGILATFDHSEPLLNIHDHS